MITKETLKIGFADMWDPWEKEDFITPILNQYFNIVIDQRNPDILFHSIFGGMKETPKYNCKKVLILAENYRSQQYKSNYSISFDKHNETNFKLPLWQIFWLLNPTIEQKLFNRVKHNEFKYFSAFVVSNPSNNLRNNHFDQLHSYKSVMSYGKVRTNSLKLQQLSKGKYWRDAKEQFFIENPHQFMMTYENTAYPYYCTEKIMDAFLVGSLPIYYGDPFIEDDWNKKAFINSYKLGTKWLDKVIELDKNKNLFNDMYSEPIFTESQKNKHLNNIEEFKNWIIKIVKK
jgi:hypothetical protein